MKNNWPNKKHILIKRVLACWEDNSPMRQMDEYIKA